MTVTNNNLQCKYGYLGILRLADCITPQLGNLYGGLDKFELGTIEN